MAQSHGATPRSTVNDTRARRPLDPNAKCANIDVRFRMGARANAAGKIVRVDSRFGEKRIENEPVDLLFRIPSNRIEYSEGKKTRGASRMKNPRRTFSRSLDLEKVQIIFISMECNGGMSEPRMQIRRRTVGEGENLLSASRH